VDRDCNLTRPVSWPAFHWNTPPGRYRRRFVPSHKGRSIPPSRTASEQRTWQSVIEPIIKKYNFDFEYRVFPVPDTTTFGVVKMERFLQHSCGAFGIEFRKMLVMLTNGITEGPLWGERPLDLTKMFVGVLHHCFKDETLPYLLEYINHTVNLHGLGESADGDAVAGADKEEQHHVKTMLSNVLLTCPAGTKWEDISFTLKSNELVNVLTPAWRCNLLFSNLGFQDKRKGDRPNRTTWKFFELLAVCQGDTRDKSNIISMCLNKKSIAQLPERARRLNAHLQKIFGIKESIYQGHYRKFRGYVTRFQIQDSRQFPNHAR
jgi:hypothetical protein